MIHIGRYKNGSGLLSSSASFMVQFSITTLPTIGTVCYILAQNCSLHRAGGNIANGCILIDCHNDRLFIHVGKGVIFQCTLPLAPFMILSLLLRPLSRITRIHLKRS